MATIVKQVGNNFKYYDEYGKFLNSETVYKNDNKFQKIENSCIQQRNGEDKQQRENTIMSYINDFNYRKCRKIVSKFATIEEVDKVTKKKVFVVDELITDRDKYEKIEDKDIVVTMESIECKNDDRGLRYIVSSYKKVYVGINKI